MGACKKLEKDDSFKMADEILYELSKGGEPSDIIIKFGITSSDTIRLLCTLEYGIQTHRISDNGMKDFRRLLSSQLEGLWKI